MEKDEKYLIQLRDCFTGGYTLPQYCIDNGIRKPLFVSEKKFELFMWEVYVQFRYDKRLTAQFATLDAPSGNLNFSLHEILSPLTYKNFSEINSNEFDAIILLTAAKKDFSGNKVIYLNKLVDYFTRKTYYEIPVLNFLQRYPKVKFIMINFPLISQYKGGKEFSKQNLPTYENMLKSLQARDDNFKTTLNDLGYNQSEILEITQHARLIRNSDGTTTLRDDNSPLKQVQNGKRVTAYQPAYFQNRIYCVGTCHQFGIHAPFDKTIESYLQKLLNENNLPYCVENEGQSYWGRHQDFFYNLNMLTPAPGDIILSLILDSRPKNLPFLDLSNAFAPPINYQKIYCTKGHGNELGYKIMAEKIFKFLTENNFFRDKELVYPPPQSTNSSLRYTAAIRDG